MTDTDLVLFANEAFYRAFADRDQAAMDAIWSRNSPCMCLHPGWGPIIGREDVMESWAAIIANPESPEITCHDAIAQTHGDTASVVCYEKIGDQYLVATNVFVRDGNVWKLVHHHAGPTMSEPDEEDPDEAERVH